jgi:hypothetical protein
MAAMGIPHDDIALRIGLRSPKTIRKHFREELHIGSIDADYKVAKTLFQMATSGEHPAATIFWAKTRNGFREHPHCSNRPVAPPPPFIVARDQEGGQS